MLAFGKERDKSDADVKLSSVFRMSAVAGAFALGFLVWHSVRGNPAIISDLPRVGTQADHEFDRRIKARFPVDSSAAEMERALRADGFGQPRPYKNRLYVTIVRRAGVVEERFFVTWDAVDDKLTSIKGSVGYTGP